nr:thioredoxin domain-containing protein [Corynebacterium lactis]
MNEDAPKDSGTHTENSVTPDEETLNSWSEGSEVTEKSWYAIPTAAWFAAVVALLVVGAVGFWAGSKSTEFSESPTYNLARVSPGQGPAQAAPSGDGTFDASIFGPRAGAKLSSPDDLELIHRRDPNDPFAIGAVDAPVVMSMYSDFECPFCARFATQTEPALVKDYVDSGLLRIEWNDLPVNGPKAEKDAEAGRAAAAQGKFWEFARVLFAKATERGSGHPEFEEKDLLDAAREAGVPDMDRFTRELKDGTWAKPVADAKDFAQGLGISGTPEFLVGTSHISGAQPEEKFRDYIELELLHVKRAG